MPTYDYKCHACGAEFSREQRITEEPIKECPECGKAEARRMISQVPGFILKGGGWESDLYSGTSNKPKTSTTSSSSDSSSSSSSSDD